jgi:outer membrane lipoprotein-sorting protein
MRCSYVEPRLRALFDGELEPTESRAVSAHLQECAGCRAGLARVEAVALELRAQTMDDVPPHFAPSLEVRLARHRREREQRAARPGLGRLGVPALRRSSRLVGALAALAAVALVFSASRGIGAEEVARRAGENWSRIRNYGCVFLSRGVYQGQERTFEQSQFFRRGPEGQAEFRLDTRQDYRLSTWVSRDRVVHYLPGGEWQGRGPLVIVRPRREGEQTLPFPFGVTWQSGGNVSLDQLINQLAHTRNARLVGEERVGDRPCYRVAFTAVPPGGSLEDQYEVWVDRESYLPRRVSWYRDPQNRIVTEAQTLQVNYDVVPPGTFDFEIPEGAAVIHGDVDPHVFALPFQRARAADFSGDPVAASRSEGWNRVPSVPFPVHSPEWLPEGFELVRVRRRIGRWVDMHWARERRPGRYQVIKLVQQDGALDADDRTPGAVEVNVGSAATPIRAWLARGEAPFGHATLTWREGGTRFSLAAAEVSPEQLLRLAASLRPVTAPPPSGQRVAQVAPALPREPSQLPGDPGGTHAGEARPALPAFPAELPAPSVAAEQPPMMPEMAEEDRVAVAAP